MKLYLYLLILLSACTAHADVQMVWSVVSGGGGNSSGQGLSLEQTAGQSAAGVTRADDLVLNAGYQAGTCGCSVNLTDLAIVCQAWLTESAHLNLSGETAIDLDDFAFLALYWLEDCPAGWPLK